MSTNNTDTTNQYLTFSLSDELYALEVSKVKEVLEYQPITRVPKTPDFMRGVINVRGGIVPVVDLRLKFDLPAQEQTVDTCIIVLEISIENETITVGTIADNVHEVVEIQPEDIEPTPKIGTRLDTDFIEGIGKNNDRFLVILNIDKILTSEEITSMADQAAQDTGGSIEKQEQ
ncbi:MAG: chemotaxis protein CheW [Spirochaetia bacterium]|nr:chemotaxis protein CheW [Spirochaetia bacterium]